ncbi:MAG: LPP20 family lipoprotein [Pseudomonadota bacterium]
MKNLCILLLSLCPLAAAADDFVEWVGANSGVNWSAGEIQAEGAGVGPANAPATTARLMACRAAVVDAQRNLLESIQGVRVEGTTIVSDMMVESDVIKSSVDGVLRGARMVDRKPMDDGTCLVQMTAPLGGQFASNVYDRVFNPTQSTAAANLIGRLLDQGLAVLVPAARAAENTLPAWQASIDSLSTRLSALEDLLSTHPAVVATADTSPTGLVLDARGSNFIPSMSPKIRKLRAGIIYPNSTQQSTRQERGQLVSLFTRDLDTARRHPVVGDRPIVLKGLRTFGDTRTEIVLGTEAGERLEKLVGDGFLDDAGVIIVL